MKKLMFALLAICLMASVVHAESAWVLWKNTEWDKTGGEQHIYWQIMDAVPKYTLCKLEAADFTRKFKETQRVMEGVDKVESPKNSYTIFTHFADSTRIETFICLPETVNPNTYEHRRD